MTGQTYRATSRKFLTQARDELAAGDMTQASEKGWGAAAQAVKAVAEIREWEHRSHASLFRAVARLTAEAGSDDLARLFRSANSLHTNFYENWMESEMVSGGLDDVEQFVDSLESLLGSVSV